MPKRVLWMGLSLAVAFVAVNARAEEVAVEGAGASFLEIAKNAGFMEYIILLVSVTGFALALQCLVSMRAHLLRPPELASELDRLVKDGQIDDAAGVAQADPSFLGAVACATLANAPYGQAAMESALADAGEVEATKLLNRIGVLNLIAAIAPMLGLTGTTIGMILTFGAIATHKEMVTASQMAEGIAVALVCTFTGLMVAIPLLVVAYFLKARVTQVILEVSNDCGEIIRVVSAGELPAEHEM